jgi:uncharacterized damage-inducible protein DinB
MNRFMEEKWSWIEGSNGLRTQLMDMLGDTDLAFSPGGQNMSLGGLCREIGEIEHSYIESLKTLKQDWSYRNTEAGLDSSVSQLKEWYQKLDAELQATVAAFSDDDLKKIVERGFPVPIEMQLEIYLQALLIFFGKASIYLKAMNKPLPKQFADWIG